MAGVVAGLDHWRETVGSGAIRSAATLEALAAAFKLPPGKAAAAVERCRRDVAAGKDPFGRAVASVPEAAPFHGALITGTLAHTQGGLAVDLAARVLRPDGSPIPHLYAGGGTACGLSGDGPDGYLSGNGLLSALGLGLIAGEHAAAAIRGERGATAAP
jgi:fumarate reductase flavoprotein subunit